MINRHKTLLLEPVLTANRVLRHRRVEKFLKVLTPAARKPCQRFSRGTVVRMASPEVPWVMAASKALA